MLLSPESLGPRLRANISLVKAGLLGNNNFNTSLVTVSCG